MEEKICQSCAMPMNKEEDFGTNADGSKNEEYCTHCFQNGDFKKPDLTFEQMLEHQAKVWAQMKNISEEEARKQVEKFVPTLKKLKRWSRP